MRFSPAVAWIWLIPVVFSIHEAEEWNILRWYKKYYRDIPESTNTSIRIHIVVLSTACFILTAAAYLLNTTFLFSFIVSFLSCFILFNVTQHVIWTVQLKAYSPGLATGIVAAAVVLFVNIELIAHARIIVPFYAIAVFAVVPIVETLKAKGEMTSEVRKVHTFFIRVEKLIRRSPRR